MILIIIIPLIALLFLYLSALKENNYIEVHLLKGVMFGVSVANQEDDKGEFTFAQLALGFIMITLYYEHDED